MIEQLLFKISLLISIVFLFSCSEPNFEPEYNVPENLQPLIDKFVAEAAEHGTTLTIDNLIISYDDNLDIGICGICNTLNPSVQKTIKIATDTLGCWNNYDQFEALLYHELGHCVLERYHDNELLPNGAPKSMMVQNNIGIYSGCVYNISGNSDECNFKDRRNYYISELFDETTPIPDWAN